MAIILQSTTIDCSLKQLFEIFLVLLELNIANCFEFQSYSAHSHLIQRDLCQPFYRIHALQICIGDVGVVPIRSYPLQEANLDLLVIHHPNLQPSQARYIHCCFGKHVRIIQSFHLLCSFYPSTSLTYHMVCLRQNLDFEELRMLAIMRPSQMLQIFFCRGNLMAFSLVRPSLVTFRLACFLPQFMSPDKYHSFLRNYY